ncbi:MAG: cytochrome c3 family protein [Acidobacteria bacterium]|nr:cytochrome c3 family protein [Acidobacteriota bacterium]
MRLTRALLLFAAAVTAAGQDVEFSHKKHAPLKLACTHCHAGAAKAERATFPEASRCMICHKTVKASSPAIKRLAALPAASRIAPAERVFFIPDFIWFSHGAHAAGKVECRSCHGDVWQKDKLTAEAVFSMKFCVDCHKERGATLACNGCHELLQ